MFETYLMICAATYSKYFQIVRRDTLSLPIRKMYGQEKARTLAGIWLDLKLSGVKLLRGWTLFQPFVPGALCLLNSHLSSI